MAVAPVETERVVARAHDLARAHISALRRALVAVLLPHKALAHGAEEQHADLLFCMAKLLPL